MRPWENNIDAMLRLRQGSDAVSWPVVTGTTLWSRAFQWLPTPT